MKFRKKPVVIEAVQFDGSSTSVSELNCWMEGKPYQRNQIRTQDCGRTLFIHTLGGTVTAKPGDWLIKGVDHEFYPCEPDIFEKTYEVVE